MPVIGFLRDAKDIIDVLTRREVKLSIGGSVHDPTDPVGKLLFNDLAMVAEFEADLIRARTRDGMAIAKAKGKLRGKQPKLSKTQEAHLFTVHLAGKHTTVEIAELRGSPFNRLPCHQTRRRGRRVDPQNFAVRAGPGSSVRR